jgi:hypothetical protein
MDPEPTIETVVPKVRDRRLEYMREYNRKRREARGGLPRVVRLRQVETPVDPVIAAKVRDLYLSAREMNEEKVAAALNLPLDMVKAIAWHGAGLYE